MGRSDKKLKLERINALKKQYDTFLEDDKKRKERNEYILQKLDKMRYCTAVVQVNKKQGNIDDDRNAEYYKTSRETFRSPLNSSIQQRYIPVKDESEVLKEISKNFILIPKLSSFYTDEYVQDMKLRHDENNDWKSKYDILEQLKKKEKENTTNKSEEPYLLKAEKDTTHLFISATSNQRDQSLFESKDDLAEQIKSENNVPDGTESYSKNNNYDEKMYNEKIETLDSGDRKNIYQPQTIIETIKDTQPKIINSNIRNSESTQRFVTPDIDATQNDTKHYSSHNNIDPNQYPPELLPGYNDIYKNKDEVTIDYKTNQNIDDELTTQEINPNNLVNKINNDVHRDINTEQDDDIKYPIEIINPQDFIPIENKLHDEDVFESKQHDLVNDTIKPISNDNSVETIDIYNKTISNHFDPIVVDNTESTDGGIEAINVLNDEHYYNELNNENYVYDQEGIAENYNEELTAPEGSYQQDEYATYYEGARPENDFATEITENDEPLQRYDQNYEQQYGTAYDGEHYQQQPYEEQYSQQGGFVEHYEQVPEFEDHQQLLEQDQDPRPLDQYENLDITPQFVEQQLDNEEGFVEKQNENVETGKIEKPLNTEK